MNRKAFLLAEETLKIIIALIAISFLIYFLTSLYFANVNSQKKQQAEASLTRILDVIKNIRTEVENVTDITPVSWHLFSFVGDDKKPNACSGENCLCICYNVKINLFDRKIKECDKKGICEIVENLEDIDEIKIRRAPFVLEIEKTDKIIIREK